MVATTEALASAIQQRLLASRAQLMQQFQGRGSKVRACYLDELLPEAVVHELSANLPPLREMVRLRSLGERKFVTANLDQIAPSLRQLVIAFTHPLVRSVVAAIIGSPVLAADESFYNGGVTVMAPGDFMRPHLDNSHDKTGKRVRRVVLLYYISPVWRSDYGGHLAVWDDVHIGAARGIPYRPNRLVMIETSEQSWHSISEVVGPYPRANLTTYLYDPATSKQPVRLTRFRAWPHERLHALALDAHFHVRSLGRRLGLQRFRHNQHLYTGAARESQRLSLPPAKPQTGCPRTPAAAISCCRHPHTGPRRLTLVSIRSFCDDGVPDPTKVQTLPARVPCSYPQRPSICRHRLQHLRRASCS